MDNNQPIIVKRIKRYAAGHHGGAWKIAFADFATAMMAFFLVLWLMSSATPEQKKLISGYFQDPVGFSEAASPYAVDLGGTPTPAPDKTINPEIDRPVDISAQHPLDAVAPEVLAEKLEQERLQLMKQELQEQINQDIGLKDLKDQIIMDVSSQGLRIQIRDAANRPMFALGSARLQPYFEDVLLAMVETLKGVPNRISISGHTDAKPYAGRNGQAFGNWELSADRANAARRVLAAGGYPDSQVARIAGYASTVLLDRDHPYDASNRRIEILVLTRKALEGILGTAAPDSSSVSPAAGQSSAPAPAVQTGVQAPVAPPVQPGSSAGPAARPASPAGVQELPAGQLRQQLNIFEDGVLKMKEAQ